MVADSTYYELLEISTTATPDEIRKSYRKLCLIHHPDRQSSQLDPKTGEPIKVDHSKFQAIQHAYETLSDEDKRADYDRFGADGPGRGGRGGGMPDMDDIFASMFGGGFGAGPSFSSHGGAAGPGKKGPVPSRTSHVDLAVSLEDCYKGAEKHVQIERSRKCGSCKGTGAKPKTKRRQCVKCQGSGKAFAMRHMGHYIARVPIECPECDGEGYKVRAQDACKKCHGSRVTEEKKKVSIHIERGTVPGEKIIVKGEGDQNPDSSAPGDLCITLRPIAHPTFKLASQSSISAPHNLMTTLSLTLSESLLGFSRLILVHLDGRGLHVKQPAPGEPGWRVLKTGDKVVVKSEGMWKKGQQGDLILSIEVEMPDEAWAMKLKDTINGTRDLEKLLPPKRVDVKTTAQTDEVELSKYDETEYSSHHHYSSAGANYSDDDDEDYDDDEDDEEDYEGPQCHQQ